MERNGGDWRLRRTPAQKSLNGKPPAAEDDAATETTTGEKREPQAEDSPSNQNASSDAAEAGDNTPAAPANDSVSPQPQLMITEAAEAEIEAKMQNLDLDREQQERSEEAPITTELVQDGAEEEAGEGEGDNDDDDDDDDGWITPSNLNKHRAKDASVAAPSEAIQETLQAALLTSDFAMQNVALRINLKLVTHSTIASDQPVQKRSADSMHSLVSPSNLSRIKQLKSWVLRCYGCFNVTRQMNKQFCPKCGQATLTRTSCSTDSSGNMRLHLKKNFQYNKRGNVYSIPKPIHGSANGKLASVQGGGKNHWGKELILAEDQKEYSRKVDEDRRQRHRDLMDEDYLPNLLSGERTGGHGRIRVGAGRNVNAKKRK